MLPAVIVGGALAIKDLVVKNIDGEVARNWTDVCENYSNVRNNHFMQNFRTKELSLMISRNMTTDTKNISGSIMPEVLSDKKIEQVERLISVLLNGNKMK